MERSLSGAMFALIAVMTWGTLPMAAQQVLSDMNAQTLVWYRFIVAFFGLLLILGLQGKLPKRRQFQISTSSQQAKGAGFVLMLLIVGALGLAANFFLFSAALNFISPTTSQVLWQLAPFCMLLCSVWLFKERFNFYQKIGLILLLCGLIVFFNNKFEQILRFDHYALGILLGSGAAVIWVLYGIAQKALLKYFTSQQILLMIYFGCALFLLPFADFSQLIALQGAHLSFFIYCCLNTLIGYGAYAEALNRWDASKVSVITVLLPIFTMIFSLLGHRLFPNTFSDPDMNTLSYIGALIVVAGTLLSSTGHKYFKKGKNIK